MMRVTRGRISGRFAWAVAALATGVVSPAAHADPTSVAAVRSGLAPASLLMAGLTSAQIAQLMGRLRQSGALDQLLAAEAAVDQRQEEFMAARERLSDQPADPQLRSQLAAAAAQLESAQQALRERRAALRSWAVESLPAAAQEAVVLQAQRSATGLPAAFRAANLTLPEQRAVRAALVAERRAQRLGTAVPAEAAALLAQIRGRPEVVEAQRAISTGLGAVEELFAL